MPRRRKLDANAIAQEVVASYSLPARGRANHRIVAPLATAARLGHEAGCACVFREKDARRIAAQITATVDIDHGKTHPLAPEDLETMIFDGIRTYFEEYRHD